MLTALCGRCVTLYVVEGLVCNGMVAKHEELCENVVAVGMKDDKTVACIGYTLTCYECQDGDSLYPTPDLYESIRRCRSK